MSDTSLAHFVEVHHDEIVARCRAKVAARTFPKPTDQELDYGIPLFLKQLAQSLRGKPNSGAMHATAGLHGGEMHGHGFTVTQVVHDYGDACQSITGLATELNAEISTEDFRELNATLDNAIADAVAEFTRRRELGTSAQDAHSTNERLGCLAHEMHNFAYAAMLAFDAMKKGTVGPQGSTGALLGRSLMGIRDLADNTLADVRLTAGIKRAEQIDVRAFLEDLQIGAHMEAQDRGLRLAVAPGAEGVTVMADLQILVSVVTNLVQNALKFTRRGGEVTLRSHATSDRVTIEVEDECGGLRPGTLDSLFLPFEQRNGDRSGVGLGLTICRRGVDAIGGDISARNLLGKGCVFTVGLPRSVAP